jgi:hypothetical protein
MGLRIRNSQQPPASQQRGLGFIHSLGDESCGVQDHPGHVGVYALQGLLHLRVDQYRDEYSSVLDTGDQRREYIFPKNELY